MREFYVSKSGRQYFTCNGARYAFDREAGTWALSMSEQRPTPETDDESTLRSYRFSDAPDASIWINSDFARKLERERDEALSKLVKLGRMIEIADSANDAKTEAEVALSTTFAEAMALTDRDMIAAELEEERKLNQTFRSAQKACEDCDAPTMEEVKQLRQVVDELAHHLSTHWSDNGFEPTQAAGALRRYNDLPHVQAGKKKPQ